MGKFEQDYATVMGILNKQEITHDDRMILLSIYKVSYHDDGKIEQIYSCDSSCANCSFCQSIRENSKDNPFVICNYCYDDAQEKRWVNVKNRHGLNLLIMSRVRFEKEELSTLSIRDLLRFNSSGDIENDIHAENYINIAYTHPDVDCGLFAKNVAPVIRATDKLGKPANMKYVQSSILIGKPARRAKYFDIVFTVYATKEELEKALAEGAGECNGKKCKDCGFKCYRKNGWKEGSNVAEYLRLRSEKQRAELLKKLGLN